MALNRFLISSVLLFLPFGESAWSFSGSGSGTEAFPYVITTAAQLQEMNLDLSAHYVLGNDIDASETASWNGGAGFEPIGRDGNRFVGHLDGKGHAILNLFINRPSTSHVGLFGYIASGSVRNVGIDGGRIAGFIGVGGLVGTSHIPLSKCYARCEVVGSSVIGGLVGSNGDTLSECFATGRVSGAGIIGGLVGSNNFDTVINSYAKGSVSTRGGAAGGLIGTNLRSTVLNCYSSGQVTGTSDLAGGLIGQDFTRSSVTNSYWDTERSGRLSSAGGAGNSTPEMYEQGTYEEWDFATVWWIDEGNHYPRFYWEDGSPPMPTPTPLPNPDPGDLNLDGETNALDLLILLGDWKKVTQ